MALQTVAVRLTDPELKLITARAKKAKVSRGSYFRKIAGFEPRPIGGFREGAGRPRKAAEAEAAK